MSVQNNNVLLANTKNLIFGRLGLIFLLLLATWWWTNTYLDWTIDAFPRRLFLLFLVSIALTVFYFLILKFNQKYLWQIRIQFLVDTLLITWLVGETGDFVSPYITLYIVLISVAGYFLGNRETLFYAILSALFFSVLSILSSQSLIYSLSGEVPPSRFVQIIAFNSIGILIVGLLAARLSERRNVSLRLREKEESFDDLNVLHERILESIRSGLITTDLGGRIRTFNRAACEILGRSADNTIGESVYSLFAENIRPSVDLCLFRAAEGQAFPTEHFESVTRDTTQANGDGSSTVACSVAPLIGKTGMVTGLILTFQDITEIRSMEVSLRRSDKLAAVGRMAAGLAHEIRNPLGSMSSALQFLDENGKRSKEESSLMDVVLRESDRLNEIITDFLSYARLSAGGTHKDKFQEVNVTEAIRDCFVLLAHSPEIGDNHSLSNNLTAVPVNITANKTQIKQVLWNLFQNSINAMPEGGNINVSLDDSPGENVRIVFEDTGCGMSPDQLEHLFEPFSNGSNGAGLGLFIAHKIIRDHGGQIDVESFENVGTKITVVLPH